MRKLLCVLVPYSFFLVYCIVSVSSVKAVASVDNIDKDADTSKVSLNAPVSPQIHPVNFLYWDSTCKYMYMSRLYIDVENTERDYRYLKVSMIRPGEKMEQAMLKAEEEYERKYEESMEKKSSQKDIKSMRRDCPGYKSRLADILENAGYTDTVKRVFNDYHNVLILEARIDKETLFTSASTPIRRRCKVYMTWYFKNTYNEVLDSVEVQGISEEHTGSSPWETVTFSAIERSYTNLEQLSIFKKNISNVPVTNTNLVLNIDKPVNTISDKRDAVLASVIVKTPNGHGSGFAISNDGYIITNYHVIAGRAPGDPAPITIITSQGEEVPATMVRYNSYKDIVLLKSDITFEKSFLVSNENVFKPLVSIYTIGAPKSLELGQSITSGVTSNERKINNDYLLQLGMSVNSGNSGGPVFDGQGKLYGIIVSKLIGENTEGVCFAIPAFLVQEYLNIQYK